MGKIGCYGGMTTGSRFLGSAAEGLPYPRACLVQHCRLTGPPRGNPGETVDGHYVPKGNLASVGGWYATRLERSFHHAFTFIPERRSDHE
jgi:hypothetical protein